MAAFIFKIERDQYYRDVVIDHDSLNALPERSTHVATRLKFVDCDIEEYEINAANNEGFPVENFPSHTYFFVTSLPNEWR